jgi:hypothetical protein
MAYDGANVALFSGDTGAGRPQDTWQWSGSSWAQLNPASSPPGLEEHELIYVPTLPGALLFGGWAPGIGHVADPWTLLITGQWTRLGSVSPPGSGTHAMAADPASGQSLMFGGYQDNQINAATWSYQANAWVQLAPTASPAARVEAAMAFDAVRQEFVLFGGANGTNYYSDTWVYAGGTWTQRLPVNTPPSRWGHMMAFDAGRGTVVLFSGRAGGGSNNLSDTWEWNGTNWSPLSPSATPPAREDGGLVFDSRRGELLLFGGWVGGSGFASDTWAFRAGNWVLLSPTNSPAARSEHVMAYDSWRDRTVLFGGEASAGRVSDTWEWDGVDWRMRSPATGPERREEAAMVFDARAGECVMFGGWDVGHFTDTWRYGSRPAATVVSYGSGCQGSAPSAPTLTVDRLWLGDSVSYRVAAPAPASTALLLFGVTRISAPLAAMGMPGCTLLTDPLFIVAIPTSGSTATLPFTVPTTASLIGFTIRNQAAVGQPGANSLGLLATAGVEATAGLR